MIEVAWPQGTSVDIFNDVPLNLGEFETSPETTNQQASDKVINKWQVLKEKLTIFGVLGRHSASWDLISLNHLTLTLARTVTLSTLF